jgi:flagellar protein FlbD
MAGSSLVRLSLPALQGGLQFRMIPVTRFNGSEFFINAVLVESVEATPDTLITLVNGKKLVVKEPVEVILERIETYHRKVGLVAIQAKQLMEG